MAQGLSRRNLLGASMAGIAAATLSTPAGALMAPRRRRRAKNIIFMVSDGMSMGVPSMLDHYLQMEIGRPSEWRKLMMDPEIIKGLQDTRSLSSLVTDSAAASSSWGSGQHVWNGMINTYPDETELRPLYDILMKDAKMKTGLVTTATITHATPAGFAVCQFNRDDEHIIAEKYLKLGVDVLMGGGNRFFDPTKRKDKKDLYAAYAAAGYHIARNSGDVANAKKGKKLLAIFSEGHVPYYVDRMNPPSSGEPLPVQNAGLQPIVRGAVSSGPSGGVPSLTTMTKKALELLSGSKEGFILQVEAARVDHAAHGNDMAGLLYDQWEFDDAIAAVIEWAKNDGETLVVVTSDHGNSNPGLNGAGAEYFESTKGLQTLGRMTSSYERMAASLATANTVTKVQELIEANLAIQLKANEASLVVEAVSGTSALKPIEQYQLVTSSLSIALSNYTHVGWTGRQHTDDYTLVSAYGPGAEAWHGLTQNISYFDALLALKGLKHKNPKMSYEDAKKSMDAKKAGALQSAVLNHWM